MPLEVATSDILAVNFLSKESSKRSMVATVNGR